MQRFIAKFVAGLLLAGGLPGAQAFSMIGTFPAWQTQEIGYPIAGELGGPMNIGEEYRHNIPLLTYGFDESFLTYFGAKGVEEIEKVFAYLNGLSDYGQMSDEELARWPLDTRRFNHQASALALFDLRSYALGLMVEQMGLAPAERYTWTLRSRVVINDIPIYSVIKRNFDPFTRTPSAYVNGTLYTYQILQTYADPDIWEAVEIAVDPTRPTGTSVSSFGTDGGTLLAPGAYLSFTPGVFFTGLTRDDIGGLRHLYHPTLFHVENPPTNVVRAPLTATEENVILTEEEGGNPWGPPTGGTNAVVTNVIAPVLAAVRGGLGKLSFVRVDFDSLIGAWAPVTNRYVDTFVTNGIASTQVLDRVLPAPDFLFAAADLGVDAAGEPIFATRSLAFSNNDAINGIAGNDGPGTIAVGSIFTFSKLGQSLLNIGGGGEIDALQVIWWGTYDGTTNEPVVYPVGTSIRQIEQIISSGLVTEGPNPWLPPPLLLVGGGAQPTNLPAAGGAIAGGATGGGGTTP